MQNKNKGLLFIVVAIAGYLIGAISFARVVARLFAPQTDMSRKLEVTVPDSEAKIKSDVISATTVRLRLGARYGCLTSVLDMVKVALPAFLLKQRWPEQPFYLVYAAAGTAGHNYPPYYKFRGGRGLSPILGGMLAMDWLGTLVCNNLGFLIGYPLKNNLVITGSGIILMVPWTWWRSRDPLKIGYTILMNILFWNSMRPELREYVRLRREGQLDAFQNARAYRIVEDDGQIREETFTLATMGDVIRQRLGRR